MRCWTASVSPKVMDSKVKISNFVKLLVGVFSNFILWLSCAILVVFWQHLLGGRNTFPVIQISEKIPGKRVRGGCVCLKFTGGNQTVFACVCLGKVSFWLISFDAQLCLKRNLEGNIVPWIIKTYSSYPPNFFSNKVGHQKI